MKTAAQKNIFFAYVRGASDGAEIVGFGESSGGVSIGSGENAESGENENEEATGVNATTEMGTIPTLRAQ